MQITLDCVQSLCEAVLVGGARKATKYLSERDVIKVSYHGKRDARSRTHHVVLTVGAPNYAERKFIKALKKSGEPFPVKKIQLKFQSK